MELGKQILDVINTLKEKNQMVYSHEKSLGSNYESFKFTTTIDGLNYTVANYQEILPHWKDSGAKGDFLNIVTVTDSNNNHVAKASTTYGGSYILDPQNTTIDIEKLKAVTDSLEVLPKKDIEEERNTIINSIKSIRNNEPKVESTYGLKFDWK